MPYEVTEKDHRGYLSPQEIITNGEGNTYLTIGGKGELNNCIRLHNSHPDEGRDHFPWLVVILSLAMVSFDIRKCRSAL